jgi:hypothetical protein
VVVPENDILTKIDGVCYFVFDDGAVLLPVSAYIVCIGECRDVQKVVLYNSTTAVD